MQRLERPMTSKKTNRGSVADDVTADFGILYRRTVGRYLRQQRSIMGMRQVDIGNATKLGHTLVCGIEKGSKPIPPARLDALCTVLELPREEFGKFVLRNSNPWIYDLIYGATDSDARKDIQAMAELPKQT